MSNAISDFIDVMSDVAYLPAAGATAPPQQAPVVEKPRDEAVAGVPPYTLTVAGLVVPLSAEDAAALMEDIGKYLQTNGLL